MLKRIFLGILLLFTSYVPAHSAEIVNVEYVHSLIKKVWDIDVPYYEDSLKYAANMEYLLKAVDKANEILNGTPTTDYGNSEYATLYAADTVATIDAVNRLIEKQNKSSFFITTTPDTSSFSFQISAAGEYAIDWGDGEIETITKIDTTMTPYSHTYDKAGEYTIGLGGKATDYNDADIDITQEGFQELAMMSAAISFMGNTNIAKISGSLGEIFSTLPDGSQPRFVMTFAMTPITSIPENLFSGVQGDPTDFMFVMTFGMTSITSIPENLFSGIQGEPKSYMFSGTFVGCTSLTGIIPEDLFAGIQGAPANSMFDGTFYGCAGLTGIPENLFAGISGAPAEMMFNTTFSGCSGLTSIPVDLFAGIQGAPASGMFWNTFSDCSGLTSIPAGLFAGIQGTPAENMFALTFDGCSGLTGEIPLGLFGELSGVPAHSMFWDTFNGCEGLTGPSARMPDGTYLYDYFDTATSSHVGDMYRGATGLDDYPCIPTAWGGAGGVCAPKSSFFITTTPDTSSFDIMISAAGEYTIDWGDGEIETITKTDTTMTPYSHAYDKAGEYTIGLGGKATDYNDAEIDITQEGSEELLMMSAAISFGGNTNIANISGSLGEIFSTLPDGSQPRFAMTFMMTPITSIPAGLFSGIQGAPKDFMFAMTFVGTPITSIPENLFSGIQGAPANGMFYGTFGMTPITSIPDGLFDGISGAPAEMMFAATFTGCANLSGEIPLGLFGELSGTPAEMMFMMTFSECSGLTGPSARQPDGTYLYDYFDTATITQVGGMYTGATGLEDYPCIPELWGGMGGYCGTSAFYITTTPDTSSFDIMISAAGEYTIDWGDGKTDTITKTDTTMTPYSHTYDKAGQYFIGLDGKATDYSYIETDIDLSQEDSQELLMMSAAISFMGNTNIAEISGSLGEIFSTLPDGRQPRFAATFMETSLVSIPENLFSGVQGAPTDWMFMGTFAGTPITSIPENLFSGIQGAPANGMFYGTFVMTPITAIPVGLFDGISGAPASGMFSYTFSGCSNLSGEIPLGLFGELSGASAKDMFVETFSGCSGLTGPSARQPDGTYLYDYFDNATITQVGDMYKGATGLEDYPCIPTAWGGAGGVCTPPIESEFYITTTPTTSSFSFQISAAGKYTIAWGDGKTETITKTDTTMTPYSHTYDKAGEYTIGIGGQATAYSSSTSTAAVSFPYNTNIAGISGSLGKVFSTLSDGTQPRFYRTFEACSGLTSIPENLFAGIQGAPASGMFESTFQGCRGLTSIPENLFAGIQGAPAISMFESTFDGCSGLTGEIPADLFAGIQGAPASNMFAYTFYGCTNLTGSIPENLFAGITGAPASNMFAFTFYGCTNLTGSIPENLFAGIQGAPASNMFSYTFQGCTGLTGEIPADLFAGIQGAPASNMFQSTFNGCSGLTGEIPAGLFAGITGAPAEYMFYSTFNGCSGLTGEIPAGLFGELSGAPASGMFYGTFNECSGLTGEIPLGLFGTFTSNTPHSYMFQNTFNGCSKLTGPSARQPDGTYLYDYFDTASSNEVGGMYTGATGLEDYPCIPTAWGGMGGYCGTSAFYITTTPDTSSFSFKISAAGKYAIDWGDGNIERITKTNTTETTYHHRYDTAGEYTIGLGGQATAYSTSAETAAVSFSYNTNIAGISGSLGKVFSTLSDGTQPRFYQTFYGCTNLTGSIPEGLFAGIKGAPAASMFYRTFYGCSGLTSIPAGLFAGIKGAPAETMFFATFNGCTGLTSIPAGLFAGITGAPASYMFGRTFSGCSGLTGEIPLGLFGELSGAPAEYMFESTFSGCRGLTGPSARQPDGTYLYDYFNTATTSHVINMYSGATGLSDYSSIPAAWK